MSQQIQKAYTLSTEWERLERADDKRIGTIIQNQSTNTNSILISCNGAPTSDFAAIELVPSGSLYEDILPPNGDIWAKAVGGAATLTLVLKYRG